MELAGVTTTPMTMDDWGHEECQCRPVSSNAGNGATTNCERQCASRGMVMTGVTTVPMTANDWGHEECQCGPAPQASATRALLGLGTSSE
jgi:hypothetical protein